MNASETKAAAAAPRPPAAAVVLRRLLPVAVVLPLAVGFMVFLGERAGFHSSAVGLVAVVAVTIAGAVGLSLWTAASVAAIDQDRARAEDELRRSREQHRVLARTFPDGAVVLFDHELRHVIADGAGLAAVGLSSERMEGRTIHEVFPAEVCDVIERPYRAALEGEESTFEYGFGNRTYFVRVVPVRDRDSGTIAGGATVVVDVTQRKRDEAAREEANELFGAFFENAPIGVAIVAPDGRWLRVNRALADLVGYSREELLAKTFQEITHPDDLDADLALVREVLAGERDSFMLEKRYLHKAGHAVWIQLSVSLVRDADGAPLYFVSQVEGIDDRKAAEEALRRSQATLAEAQKLAGLGSWEWRAAEDVIVWSDELYRIFGLEPGAEELRYDTYLARVHPDDRSFVEDTVGRAADTGETFVFEHRIIRPDAAERWVQGRGEVVRNSEGVVMFGTAQDITERRQAEERLRAAEERYRQLVEHLPLVTYIRPLDLHAGNVYCSPQVEAMLGYSADDWRNDPDLIEKIAHPDDLERIYAVSQQVRASGEPRRGEYRFIKPGGEVVWVQDETYVLHDEDGRPTSVSGYLLDITERKRAEAERDRLEEEVLHSRKLEAVGQLAGGVAHEFNNLLMAIRGHTELLLERLPAGTAQHADARQVLGAAERATTLTRQLLAFGRKQVLNERHVDLGEAAASAVELLRPLIQPRITLTANAAPGLPSALADPAQVEQMLVNLILNSRDAIEDRGTITLATTVAHVEKSHVAGEHVAPGTYIGITVSDTGSGLTDETRAHMFEPFFTTKEVGAGSGLGLATVYGIVRQGGGFVDVETELGRGTSVTLYLPAATDVTVSTQSTVPTAQLRVLEAPARALVVDDEDSVRDVCAAMLESLGYEVETACDGEDALRLLKDDPAGFQLVLSDVVMPGISGWELAGRVSVRHPATPVVCMSGYPGEDGGAAADGAGLLQKPFTLAELRAALPQHGAGQHDAGSGRRAERRPEDPAAA